MSKFVDKYLSILFFISFSPYKLHGRMSLMIKKIGNPLDEQETIINLDPKQISDRASVYTTIPATLNRMWKLHEQFPEECIVTHDDKWGSEFSVPANWIVVKPKRKMSDEQRQAAAERLAEIRKREH